ncbi:hypothetical protein [Clostridium grantii]|uniref:Uncharacterized protein n=1 Tax=Clostridium grantii DSM 8605 TaxID=1121316 RepID=A0A1M5XRX6_9CLOT|nr:hypothetical protein [Clostridium grantii]SHI02509.1 hypothetical protein SAMN02745207_03882 [Clostridium grantii DSM 8605]
MNIKKDWGELRFATATLDGKCVKPVFDNITGSGHPTFHPNGKFLITDTYTHQSLSYGDGTIPLRLIYLETGEEITLVRINTLTPYQQEDLALRVDPHPA